MSRIEAAVVVTILGWTAMAGCSSAHREPVEATVDSAQAVSVFVVGDSAPAVTRVLAGRVKAREEVTITAAVAGRLTALPFREGEHFLSGQVLARFDAPEARAQLQAAREQTRAAEQHLAKARHDEVRAESLWAGRVISEREVEGARVEHRLAEAGFLSAQAAEHAYREGTSIPAPFHGFVTRRHIDPGQWVGAGQSLLDVRSDEVEGVEVAVPESAIPALAVAQAFLQQGDGPWRPARIVRADAMTDPGTRTRDVVFRPLSDAQELEPGAYARVRLVLSDGTVANGPEKLAPAAGGAMEPIAIGVPASSIVRRGQLAGVFLVRDGRAYLRWLRLGAESGGQIEVLAGLSSGETVIVDAAGLVDGRAVRVSR